MRKILLSTVAIMAMTGSALAADLPSRKAAPAYIAPVPAFSWTGFYVGIEGGADFLSANSTTATSATTTTTPLACSAAWSATTTKCRTASCSASKATPAACSAPSTPRHPGNFYTNNSYFADIRGRVGYAVSIAPCSMSPAAWLSAT